MNLDKCGIYVYMEDMASAEYSYIVKKVSLGEKTSIFFTIYFNKNDQINTQWDVRNLTGISFNQQVGNLEGGNFLFLDQILSWIQVNVPNLSNLVLCSTKFAKLNSKANMTLQNAANPEKVEL